MGLNLCSFEEQFVAVLLLLLWVVLFFVLWRNENNCLKVAQLNFLDKFTSHSGKLCDLKKKTQQTKAIFNMPVY